MEDNYLESKTNKEILGIYSLEYPSTLDARNLKRLMEKDQTLYNEMKRRGMFADTKCVVLPKIREDFEKIEEGIIKKYSLSIDRFSRIRSGRMGIELKTNDMLIESRVMAILGSINSDEILEEIEKAPELSQLYKFNLTPLRSMLVEKKINTKKLTEIAEFLDGYENRKGYEAIDKLKRCMKKICSELGDGLD